MAQELWIFDSANNLCNDQKQKLHSKQFILTEGLFY